MSEEKAPYNIGGQDPEEVLDIGALRFVRPLHGGRVRIETRILNRAVHTQQLREEDEVKLQRFMMNYEAEQAGPDIEDDDEGELEGAPATFLEIEE